MIPLMNTEQLRIAVKKSMIDLGLDHPRAKPELAEAIGVNPRSLSMALTGYRDGQRSHDILTKLAAYLGLGAQEEIARQ